MISDVFETLEASERTFFNVFSKIRGIAGTIGLAFWTVTGEVYGSSRSSWVVKKGDMAVFVQNRSTLVGKQTLPGLKGCSLENTVSKL